MDESFFRASDGQYAGIYWGEQDIRVRSYPVEEQHLNPPSQNNPRLLPKSLPSSVSQLPPVTIMKNFLPFMFLAMAAASPVSQRECILCES